MTIRYTYRYDSPRGRHWGKYGWTGPADLHSIYGSGEVVQHGPVRTALSGAVLDAISLAEKEKTTRFTSMANGAKAILQKYGAYIDKYRGPIPASVVAVRVQLESGGRPDAGPTKEGEKGLLQIWPSTATKYGVTNAFDPEQNLRAGLLHWRAQLAAMQQKLSPLLTSYNYDFWAITQLYTGIGGGATTYLLKKAAVRPGSEFTDLVAWMKQQGEGLEAYRGYFGTQSAAKVARRIIYAGFLTDVADSIGDLGGSGMLVFLAGAAFFGYLLIKRYWS